MSSPSGHILPREVFAFMPGSMTAAISEIEMCGFDRFGDAEGIIVDIYGINNKWMRKPVPLHY